MPTRRRTEARVGKIPTTAVRRLKLSCQVPGPSGVPEHGSVDRVREVALEDAHGLPAGVAMCAGLVVDLAGPGFVAELDHRDAIDGGVEAPVAPAREAVPDGRVRALARAGRDRRGAVEPGEAGLGKAPNVADLDDDLCRGTGRDADEPGERRVRLVDELGEIGGGRVVLLEDVA